MNIEPKAVDFLFSQTKSENCPPRVRMVIQGGGCAGYRYDFVFGDEVEPEDFVTTHKTSNNENLDFIIHPTEYALVSEAILGFDENDFSYGLTMRMPQRYSRCGCGSSFSPPEE